MSDNAMEKITGGLQSAARGLSEQFHDGMLYLRVHCVLCADVLEIIAVVACYVDRKVIDNSSEW
jgi:hypothetical protein